MKPTNKGPVTLTLSSDSYIQVERAVDSLRERDGYPTEKNVADRIAMKIQRDGFLTPVTLEVDEWGVLADELAGRSTEDNLSTREYACCRNLCHMISKFTGRNPCDDLDD